MSWNQLTHSVSALILIIVNMARFIALFSTLDWVIGL